MLTQHIALVPEANGIDASELARVSAALQKQVTRDFSSVWGVVATVDAFPYLEDVPVGYWPIVVCSGELGTQSGVHRDRSGQPYALVQAAKGWSLLASRACLEMLVNPFENRTVTAPSLRSDQAAVEFLVEVCGPCESERHAYTVDGVVVSDFCTPAYFEAHHAGAERFSWSGSLTQPLKLIAGGHITWYDPITEIWWLRNHWGENPVDTKIGALESKLLSVRELVQVCSQTHTAATRPTESDFARRELQSRRASIVRAQRLRSLLGARLEVEPGAKGDVAEADGSEEVALFLQEESSLAFNPVIERPREQLRIEPESVEFEPVIERSRKQPRSEPADIEFEPVIERFRERPRSEPERIEATPTTSSRAAPKRTSSLPPPLPPPTPRAPQVRASSIAPPIGRVKRRPLPRARSRTELIGSAVVGVGLGAFLWAFGTPIKNLVLQQLSSPPTVSTAIAEPHAATEPPSGSLSAPLGTTTQAATALPNAPLPAESLASKTSEGKLAATVTRPHKYRARVASSASLPQPLPQQAPESARNAAPTAVDDPPLPKSEPASGTTEAVVASVSSSPLPASRSEAEHTANIDDLIDTRR